jgi:hypothetical protein
MGATLYRGSIVLAIASAAMGALAVLLAIRQWLS